MKFCAQSGDSDFGALSVLSALICERQFLFEVPPQSFTPAPKVMSAVMLLKKTREFSDFGDIEAFKMFLKDCFKAPRKQLLNNLKFAKAQILQALNELNLSPSTRAHELSVKSFLEIYEKVKDYYERGKSQLGR